MSNQRSVMYILSIPFLLTTWICVPHQITWLISCRAIPMPFRREAIGYTNADLSSIIPHRNITKHSYFTSWNYWSWLGKYFCITGPLWMDSPHKGPGKRKSRVRYTKGQLSCIFHLLSARTSCWAYRSIVGDLRRWRSRAAPLSDIDHDSQFNHTKT